MMKCLAQKLCCCYGLVCLFIFLCLVAAQAQEPQKPILIVTTDFGQDPDDQQSMVRLLHYANDFHIAGIIANADGNYAYEAPEIRIDLLYEMLDAYGEMYPNLKKMDPDYPSARELKKRVKAGCAGNGRTIPVEDYIGKGKSTEGSQWIIEQVDLATSPIHIAIWGGACDLAQALFDVSRTRPEEALRKFIQKLKVYFIGKQDSSNDWIIANFPELWLVLAMSHDGDSWNSSYRGIFLGGDMQLTSPQWLHKNVIGQHALGTLYPEKTWTKGGTQNPYGAMKEGDTPSFLFFLNNGLNIPERPEWGGWGGRFQRMHHNLYRDAEDSFFDVSTSLWVKDAKSTVSRWRPDIQADFAARVQWGRGDSRSANRYPKILINGDSLKIPLHIRSKQGASLSFDASESRDLDGDKLSFEWMVYPEAGSFNDAENIGLSGVNEPNLTLSLPQKGEGSVHLILRVKDNSVYPLVSYKRVIIEVGG